MLCQTPAAPRKLRTFQKGGRSEGKRAAQRRASRAAPLDFWAKTRQKLRSATSCVDSARSHHLRIRSRKVTNIFSSCPTTRNFRGFCFMHFESLEVWVLSVRFHAMEASKSNSAYRVSPKNGVPAVSPCWLVGSFFGPRCVANLVVALKFFSVFEKCPLSQNPVRTPVTLKTLACFELMQR